MGGCKAEASCKIDRSCMFQSTGLGSGMQLGHRIFLSILRINTLFTLHPGEKEKHTSTGWAITAKRCLKLTLDGETRTGCLSKRLSETFQSSTARSVFRYTEKSR